MALFPKTPGVYIQEISTLPSSIVAAPTAIPVFIGYTEKAVLAGETLSLPTDPVRITSMLDFQTIFGGPHNETFDVTLTGPNVNITSTLTTSPAGSDYRLFYQMQMYFANGGGPCYIVSVGETGTDPITASDMQGAIALAEKVDEITLVVVPEATSSNINDADRKGIYDEMLKHCAKMKDRFSIVDVLARGTSIADDADKFRNLNVGANNLSYGASYYPPFDATLSFSYDDMGVTIVASDLGLPAGTQAFDGKTLNVVNNGINGTTTLDFSGYTFPPTPPVTPDTLVINGITFEIVQNSFSNFFTAISTDNSLSGVVVITSPAANKVQFVTSNPSPLNITYPIGIVVSGTPPTVTGISPDKALYTRIKNELAAYPVTLYPSSMMAGIYAAVDNDRGVWKAPANVGVSLVSSLKVNVKDSDQGGLNVDPVGGKSIDAIRQFSGRGMLVWGARTMDGNSNEWRYINVRRLFLSTEDACKHATEFIVFEPNDMNTWVRVKAMISNFLTGLWRDGALAGAKPEQAFFVRCGLNETMTAQDILEGKMIVQIGLAAVRPAEFIVLQFEHKLQEA